jgi:hypothetical protein
VGVSVREELQKRLRSSHSGLMSQTSLWCGQGWYSLLYALAEVMEPHRVLSDGRTMAWGEAKEKFAGLRVHAWPLDEYLSGASSAAQALSFRICDLTGEAVGVSIHTGPGRYRSLSSTAAQTYGYLPDKALPGTVTRGDPTIDGGWPEERALLLSDAPVIIPAGWSDLSDGFLAWLARRRKRDLPELRVESIRNKDGCLVAVVDGGDDAVDGGIALLAALTRRIDPNTGMPVENLGEHCEEWP